MKIVELNRTDLNDCPIILENGEPLEGITHLTVTQNVVDHSLELEILIHVPESDLARGVITERASEAGTVPPEEYRQQREGRFLDAPYELVRELERVSNGPGGNGGYTRRELPGVGGGGVGTSSPATMITVHNHTLGDGAPNRVPPMNEEWIAEGRRQRHRERQQNTRDAALEQAGIATHPDNSERYDELVREDRERRAAAIMMRPPGQREASSGRVDQDVIERGMRLERVDRAFTTFEEIAPIAEIPALQGIMNGLTEALRAPLTTEEIADVVAEDQHRDEEVYMDGLLI